VLLLIAQLFTGCQFITEEKILSGYYLDPLYVVGWEGFFGCLYYTILLPIFQNVSCTNPDLCNGGVIENSRDAFKAFGEHKKMIILACGIIVSIAGFNAFGVTITKHASAAQRSTIDTSRTLLIWLISIAMGQEDFLWGELAAFVLLVLGTLIYNEIWIVPIEFLRYNTKPEIKKRE